MYLSHVFIYLLFQSMYSSNFRLFTFSKNYILFHNWTIFDVFWKTGPILARNVPWYIASEIFESLLAKSWFRPHPLGHQRRKNVRCLTLNGAGPNQTYLVRGGSGLTTQPKLKDFHRTMNFFRYIPYKIYFSTTFVFLAMSKKSLFGPRSKLKSFGTERVENLEIWRLLRNIGTFRVLIAWPSLLNNEKFRPYWNVVGMSLSWIPPMSGFSI